MEGDANAPPDIAALLQSLTAHLPKKQEQSETGAYEGSGNAPQHYQQQYLSNVVHPAPTAFAGQYPHEQLHQQQYYTQQTFAPGPYQYQASGQTPQQAPAQRLPVADARTSTPPQPRIDPRSITTWPAALRYITKLSGTNDEFLPRIRALIKNQHDNERQWWAGREALVEQQGARAGGKQELDDVLLSIGVETSKDHGTYDHDAEIKRYDVKVHKAQTKMIQVITAELKGLGLPFLGSDQTNSELRKKMLQFLEELCKD